MSAVIVYLESKRSTARLPSLVHTWARRGPDAECGARGARCAVDAKRVTCPVCRRLVLDDVMEWAEADLAMSRAEAAEALWGAGARA